MKQLPDMAVCEWGRKKDLGRLVSKAGKRNKISLKIFQTFLSVPNVSLPPGPPVVAGPAGTPMGSNGDTAAVNPMDESAAAADPMDETIAAADPMNEGAATAEIPMDESAADAVQPMQEIQEMEQDLPGVKGLANQRQAAVYNRMDPKLVPYVSLSSSEDDSSDSEGK